MHIILENERRITNLFFSDVHVFIETYNTKVLRSILHRFQSFFY